MNRFVYKYILGPGKNVIPMPQGARPLHVAAQHGEVVLWAEVNADLPKEDVAFYVVGTGMRIPADAGIHVGSALLIEGNLVVHVFEVKA